MKMIPLNGTKTHPLTKHALDALDILKRKGAQPRQEFTPGIANRLEREALVLEIVEDSPFKSHKAGRKINFLKITDAGIAALASAPK